MSPRQFSIEGLNSLKHQEVKEMGGQIGESLQGWGVGLPRWRLY